MRVMIDVEVPNDFEPCDETGKLNVDCPFFTFYEGCADKDNRSNCPMQSLRRNDHE